ncbi:MAG: ABC transporter ATP-binding protein [Clostridia bacterium]|nr:ABC transporter ATP-binding protein [Clostridia bacterium]
MGPGGRPGGPGGGRPGGPMAARLNREKPKNTKKTLVRLIRYIGKSGAILVALMAIMIVVTLVEILNPFFQQKAIDAISVVDGRLTVDLNEMMVFLAAIGITFVFSAGLTYFQGILAAKLSQRTIYSMRNDLFSKISRLSISYTDSHRHGDIMSRMTNDVENVSNAVSQSVTTLFSAVLTLIGALVMMLYYSPLLTAVAVTIVPMTLLVSSTLAKFMRKYFVRQQKILGKINSNVEESVTGYKTVVAYGKEDAAVASFAENAEELRTTAIKARVWGSIMGPIMNFLGNFHYVLLAALGGYMVLSGKGRVTVGSIQAMLLYSKKFSMPINMIANQYSTILTALAGAERIFEIMDAADEIDEGKNEIAVSDIRGDISFEDLQFGYVAGEPVLKGFALDVKAGQKIAIVGATGSGKTTVVNLLTRFYELDGGKITIDGIDITEIPKETLRRAIAIVLQDTVLFSDTIASNIRYGRESATDEDIRAAAKTAMADRFIERLPEGYETVLAESGSNLSEGQRQLLAISRAVLADPKILILDEATSSVDTRTELRLQQAMNNLMEGRTSLIIAHRLSTIRDADKIVVVSDGRIVEAGSHEELLSLGGQYAKLYSSQFAGVAI